MCKFRDELGIPHVELVTERHLLFGISLSSIHALLALFADLFSGLFRCVHRFNLNVCGALLSAHLSRLIHHVGACCCLVQVHDVNLRNLASGLDLLDLDLFFILLVVLLLHNVSGVLGILTRCSRGGPARDHVHAEIEAACQILMLLVTNVNDASVLQGLGRSCTEKLGLLT